MVLGVLQWRNVHTKFCKNLTVVSKVDTGEVGHSLMISKACCPLALPSYRKLRDVGKARVLPYCTVNMNGHGDEGAQ
jgi:hypothetical protein